MSDSFNLDDVLLRFSKQGDTWTIRDAVRGTQIFGGIGSGKSSGSGKTIAKSFLKKGFGGLVLCAKPDEKANWIRLCQETGRTDDVLVFEEDGGFQFNPLQYELNRDGRGGGEVFNLSNLFMEIYKMGSRLSGAGGSDKDRYWDNALKRSLNRMILLLKLSGHDLSIENMVAIMSSIPTEDVANELGDYNDEDWTKLYQNSFCIECILDAGGKLAEMRSDLDNSEYLNESNALLDEVESFEHAYNSVYRYFLVEFAKADEKTRSIVAESFLGLAEPFTMGVLKKHFASGVNLLPEATHEGKIIILNFPVKEYLDAGVYAQGIYKYIWQQSTERRQVEGSSIPCFLWVDEAQLFLSDYDQIFQTTARSSRACTVFISQNISNYYVAIGGSNPKAKADSLLGNLGTKIFHANNDSVTNNWAAEVIGKAFKKIESFSIGTNENISLGQQYHWQVEPREFTTLKSGGTENDFRVEGIVTVAGRMWSNGKNYMKRPFNQRS